jgi:GNAT superfamily N-acetyltransferase
MRRAAPRTDPATLIGRRVVLRFQLHEGQFSASDVLGVLETWAEGRVCVRRPDGTTAQIAVADVLAVKAVPARPVARREVRELEAAAALGWQALESRWMGGWLLRAASGFTGRANSCLPLNRPDRPLSDAVDAIERWYDERGLRPTFQVPEPISAEFAPELDRRGWSSDNPTVVLTAPIAVVRSARRTEHPDVRIDAQPDPAWVEGYHYRGGALPQHAVKVLVNAETVGFGSVDIDGRRVAIARGAVTDAPAGRRWLGVTAVEIAPEARRRGLGSHIVAGLADWAADHGATDVYLQAAAENTAALTTYERVGFTEHHRYHYRRRPTTSPFDDPTSR